MLFNTLEFGVFLLVLLFAYHRMEQRAQNRLLLAASYVFYGAWDLRFLALLVLTTGVDFLVARALGGEADPRTAAPDAIRQLVEGVRRGDRHQTLLGVTGSGKTFTISNVIAELDKPVLVLSHNKTLAAQLYGEFKSLFPKNRVEFFISYYDYYQPEAYVPSTDTYIAKDSSINEEIDRLRLRATSALLSGDPNGIVVASVSCIYGIGAGRVALANSPVAERAEDLVE